MIAPPRPPVIIVGAGLAGLACARELGLDSLLLEREAMVGGLSRSLQRSGFWFDMTGHWLHLSNPGIERTVHALMGDELVAVQRRAAIYSHGITTPYPFQANTYGRPADVVAECVLGYFRAREQVARGEARPLRSFDDYIRRELGDGFARHFMVPYNTKIWTVPPALMDHAWCERFVPRPTPEDVVQGALTASGAGRALGYNSRFWYPRAGGMGRLAQRLQQSLTGEVRTGVAATRVDWRQRIVTTSTGESLAYHVLVSTMPLDDLVGMLVDPPATVVAAAHQLAAASVTYWDIGLSRPNGPADAHWTYYPDPEIPFYRVGSPSAALPALAPGRTLCVEVSHRRGTAVTVTEHEIMQALQRVGLLAADETPVVVARNTIACAYVIMDHAYGAARATIRTWLQSQRILAVGRYGGWGYDSMEGALLDGQKAAATIAEFG